ncbi:MAG: FHA domain-containing protein [Polyangia bacterium]|jgi:hypothetical protein
MAEVLSYLEQFASQLNAIGLESFRRRNTSPFLVTLGMAGDLRNSNTSGTSIINIADGVLERGRLAGRVFPVVKARDAPRGPVLIGRTAENDIVIPEYSVSRHHCYITIAGPSHQVTDRGSANGTLVNETDIGKMKPFPLQGGEILTLGRLLLLFLLPRQFADHVQKVAPPSEF